MSASTKAPNSDTPIGSRQDDSLDRLADRLRGHRQKSRRYLSGQLARLDDIERRLLGDLRSIGDQLKAWQDYQTEATQCHRVYEQNQAKLEANSQRFATRRKRLADRLKDMRARPDVDPQQIGELEEALQVARTAHDASIRECETAAQKYEAARREAESARAEAETARAEAKTARVEAESARAEAKTAQVEAESARLEIESARAEAKTAQVEAETVRADVAASASEMATLQGEVSFEREQRQRVEQKLQESRNALVESRSEDKELRKELATSRKLLNQRAEELNQLRSRLDAVSAGGDQADIEASAKELHDLRDQRDGLQGEVTELRQRCRELESSCDEGVRDQLEDLRRQFEIAVENVRELKDRNIELERAATVSRQPSSARPTATAGEAFDWEAQKRRLFESLDADSVPSPDRVTIAETVRLTDEVVNNKDLQIARLKAEIESLGELVLASQSVVQEVTPENVHQELLDSDAVVQREREALEKLQNEWREKLRTAEVEIAVERAQTTRLRSELEEKLRDAKIQVAQAKKMTEVASSNNQGVKKGNWLERLGLSDSPDKR